MFGIITEDDKYCQTVVITPVVLPMTKTAHMSALWCWWWQAWRWCWWWRAWRWCWWPSPGPSCPWPSSFRTCLRRLEFTGRVNRGREQLRTGRIHSVNIMKHCNVSQEETNLFEHLLSPSQTKHWCWAGPDHLEAPKTGAGRGVLSFCNCQNLSLLFYTFNCWTICSNWI